MPQLTDLLSELDDVTRERQADFAAKVRSGTLDKTTARLRYDSLVQVRDIVVRYYKRVEEDLAIANEISLRKMEEANPAVSKLISEFKLKQE